MLKSFGILFFFIPNLFEIKINGKKKRASNIDTRLSNKIFYNISSLDEE